MPSLSKPSSAHKHTHRMIKEARQKDSTIYSLVLHYICQRGGDLFLHPEGGEYESPGCRQGRDGQQAQAGAHCKVHTTCQLTIRNEHKIYYQR